VRTCDVSKETNNVGVRVRVTDDGGHSNVNKIV
jgi:hypothetical protein